MNRIVLQSATVQQIYFKYQADWKNLHRQLPTWSM